MRQAGGIVLTRDNRVFLARRGGRAPFLPGFHVFPGGAIEPQDEGSTLACAVRELYEETGIRLPPADLPPCGLMVTPDYSLLRFEAQFYLAECPTDQSPELVTEELVGGAWYEPAEALQAWEKSEVLLAPPTLASLRAFAAHGFAEGARRLQALGPSNGLPGPAIPMAPGLVYLPLESPTLPPARHTLTYVVGAERLLVVDPGGPEVAPILDYLESLAPARPLEVVLTHHHPDHIQGATKLGLPIAAHPETANRLPFAVDRLIQPGEGWDLGQGWNLEALHTPGHAPGHLALWNAERRFLLAGDLVSSVSTIVIEPTEGDMAAYFDSLERMRALAPRLVLPAHGPPLGPGSDPFGYLLAHRRKREAKLLSSLTTTPQSLDQLLARVYDDKPGVETIARLALESHLEKLRREGLAVLAEGGWATSS
ncbi:MAG: MBL fold metallo-hydrolase [Candidatus Eremiobacteraeota bacterium]|nr:MBL fold metallo-hydrolase [Candidatus Eremiobacteraeota bacterium]